ncbi:MAG: NYN domain-containing protein [Patescibacteria group bacterium]
MIADEQTELIKKIHFYQGTLVGDKESERNIKDLEDQGYELHTKPVKIMELSIDATSLQSMQSSDLLTDFIRTPLLKTMTLDQIEGLNQHLQNLNQQGIRKLRDKKCNFDVEIGVNMLLDLEHNNADTFVLWSGDSDFANPIQQLLSANKRVALFATAGRISKELNSLRPTGLIIFDIRDLEKFVCWNRELRELNKLSS